MTQSTLSKKPEIFDLSKPTDILEFANMLKEIIVERKLYANIKGKNYPLVEGWQIAGAFTGSFPIVEKVENLSEGKEYKYRAEVTLRDRDNNIVGSGIAICTNKEPGKGNFDEYAVASMAQTRAVGKAFRLKIGWLLKIAGYETTPAEEMNTVIVEPIKKESKFSVGEIATAKVKLGFTKDVEELKNVWNELGDITHEQEIIDYKNEMKEKLSHD